MERLHRRQRWRAWPLQAEEKAYWLLDPDVETKRIIDLPNQLSILLLTQGGVLYWKSQTETKVMSDLVKDMCLVNDDLYLITNDGSIKVLDNHFQPLTKSWKKRLPRFQACVSGTCHLAVLDNHGSLWTSGARIQSGQLNPNADEQYLTIMDYLEGVQVLAMSSGQDFTVVIVKRVGNASASVESQDQNELSDQSCPLGVPLKDQEVILRKKNKHRIKEESEEKDTSIDDDEEETAKKVERLAKSGIYINPSDAFKFLSSQLNWIRGTQTINGIEYRKPSVMSVGQEAFEAIPSSMMTEDDPEASTPISKATSFVLESMKAVLPKSFSIDKNMADMEIEASTNDAIALETIIKKKTREDSSMTLKNHRRSQSVTSFSKLKLEDKASNEAVEDVFAQEVWTWGKGWRGQQGHGDMLDRLQPLPIAELNGQGVIKVTCGSHHALALTISGQVYGWGDNDQGQSCPSYTLAVCSVPKLISLPIGETASDIACTSNLSYILTDIGSVYSFGILDENKTKMMKKINFSADKDCSRDRSIRKILASNSCIFGSIVEDGLLAMLPLQNFKALEKTFLNKMKEMLRKIIEPLCQQHSSSSEKVKQNLLGSAGNLVKIISQSIKQSWNYDHFEDCLNLPLVQQPEKFTQEFQNYNRAACDFLLSSDASLKIDTDGKMATLINELLANLCHIHHQKGSIFDALSLLLQEPLSQIEHYLTCFKAIMLASQNIQHEDIVSAAKANTTIEKVIQHLKNVSKAISRDKKSFQQTLDFWRGAQGSKLNVLKMPSRRLVLDSKECPINVSHATSFGKHWFLLFNDVFVHAGYASHVVHPLQTLWIESHQVSSNPGAEMEDLEITLVAPEETIVLVAPNHENKNEWIVSLQKCIIESLENCGTTAGGGSSLSAGATSAKTKNHAPPILRHTTFSFSKVPELKGAEYVGAWLHGKIHGQGRLTWPDGRCYQGQFRQNQKHGSGKMQVPNLACYEGQWKLDKFEGRGKIQFASGDVYNGSVKDGKPHGQGIMRQGKLSGTGASLYIGEWNHGLKSGYGVFHDIVNGEKYMGMWSNDMKNGQGCVVTFAGLYFEGIFCHNKMSGKGLMIFEDESIFEGQFADIGVFNGAGVLCQPNGDKMEGSFYGNSIHGIKFNGTIVKAQNPGSSAADDHDLVMTDKVGSHTVPAHLKWQSIYSFYYDLFTLPPPNPPSANAQNPSDTSTALVWDQIAISINQAKNNAKMEQKNQEFKKHRTNSLTNSQFHVDQLDLLDGLEMIPDYYSDELTWDYLKHVNQYLTKAFSSPFHPLENLLMSLCDCFNTTYGGVRVYPRLLRHAVEEVRAITDGIYYFVRALFPALPKFQDILTDEEGKNEVITANSILHSHVLPKFHSSLFTLYTLHYKKEDDEYWTRIIKWNRHPDLPLLSFLGVDQKFWKIESASIDNILASTTKDIHFSKAIETLQQLKTTFTPYEKLEVLLETFKEINLIGQEACGSSFCWSMDDLFPVLQYVVVRARILQLGAEIHMIEDLMDAHLCAGEYGFIFTTLQASYFQILRESVTSL